MKLRMASLGLLFIFGAWNTEQLMPARAEAQSEALAVSMEGARYGTRSRSHASTWARAHIRKSTGHTIALWVTKEHS